MKTSTLLVLVFLLAWIVLEWRTRRPDGRFLGNLHPYRRLMLTIMPTRTESVVYFDSYVRAEKLLEWLPSAKEQYGADLTHCVVAAVELALRRNTRMNRFISGRRMYQRYGRFITFSMKRKKLDAQAKLATVKIDGRQESFAELCRRINNQIDYERSGETTSNDKEYALFNLLPRSALNGARRLMLIADYYGLLPAWFIQTDGMYASCFIANLGSLGMGPGYHHLFEWGNCPLFLMVGAIESKAIVEHGTVIAAPIVHLRWTYDERIDDGLTARRGMDDVVNILQDPAHWLERMEQIEAEDDL